MKIEKKTKIVDYRNLGESITGSPLIPWWLPQPATVRPMAAPWLRFHEEEDYHWLGCWNHDISLGRTKRLESFTNWRGFRLQTVYSRLQTTFTIVCNRCNFVCKFVCSNYYVNLYVWSIWIYSDWWDRHAAGQWIGTQPQNSYNGSIFGTFRPLRSRSIPEHSKRRLQSFRVNQRFFVYNRRLQSFANV